MKSVCIAILALVAACSAADTYDSKNDNLDIAPLAADDKIFKEFVDCFNGRIKCSTLGDELKENMPEAIQQACARCTPAQIKQFKVFLEALKQKLPADFEVYKKKYDPENKHFDDFWAVVSKA